MTAPCLERIAAIAAGQKTYFTGKPCCRGHVVKRYVIGNLCVACQRERVVDPDVIKRAQKKYYERNKAARHANVYRWRENNPERAKELHARYIKSEKGQATKNRLQALREQRLRERTTKFGQEGVAELYAEAKRLGMTVDHTVPIAHPLVSGLHNIFNLQIIPRGENFRKRNRWVEA